LIIRQGTIVQKHATNLRVNRDRGESNQKAIGERNCFSLEEGFLMRPAVQMVESTSSPAPKTKKTRFWRSRRELNADTRIRNPLLYPFELREQSCA
jgi:hypothetical protein